MTDFAELNCGLYWPDVPPVFANPGSLNCGALRALPSLSKNGEV